MELLELEETKSTPQVIFNPESNILEMRGQSYPEDASKFFDPVLSWVKLYLNDLKAECRIELNLIYLNTSSSKYMMMFFDLFEDAYNKGKDITINWHYAKENEMGAEYGEEFMEDLSVPFNLIEDE